MFRSLVHEIRFWSVVWRRRLAMYWLVGDKDHLGFLAILAVPIVMLGLIIQFAFISKESLDGSRQEAARKRALELHCLAENIYREARGEPLQGQYAVAEVTMNRLASPHFPDTICEVVHDTRWDRVRRRLVAHFSWTAFDFESQPSGPAWDQAMEVATAVYEKRYVPVVPTALFYHATSVNPYWARTHRIVARIGNHIFYR
jgi:spore germination cell wall hydrolase CwlJ-like protein